MEGGEMSQPDFSKIPPNQRTMVLYKWHTGREDYGNMYEHFENCPACSVIMGNIKELKYVNSVPENKERQCSSSSEPEIAGGGARGEI